MTQFGDITPQQAKEAMDLLMRFYHQTQDQSKLLGLYVKPETAHLPPEFTIKKLGLSVRAFNCLREHIKWDFREVPDNVALLNISEKHFKKCRNVGKMVVSEVARALEAHSIKMLP